MARNRPEPRSNRASAPDPVAHGAGAQATLGRGELLSLMARLRDELNAFLDDVEPGRESSRNRDASRRL